MMWAAHPCFRLEREAIRLLLILERDGYVLVHIANGKGRRWGDMPILPGREADMLSVRGERGPDEVVFARIPKHLDVYYYRRELF